jgi:nucleoside-diphosphate-sugar epimerase
MRVLVTGATGLIGGHLVDLIRERGDSVAALVRPGESADRLKCAGVEICWGDLGDRPSLQAAVKGKDWVINCAARTGGWGARSEYETANINGLQTLLEAALEAGVRRFVHLSSTTVLGLDRRLVLDETDPLRPLPNLYSWSKIAGERLLEQSIRERGAPVTVVRPGWTFGPRDKASFARFAAKIEQGKMVITGSGHNHVPLIYVRDVAEGILLASAAPQAAGRTYILTHHEPVTQIQFLEAIARELGVPAPHRRIPYRAAYLLGGIAEGLGRLTARQPLLTRYGVLVLGGESSFSSQRARDELGFTAKVSLAEGVHRSVAWFRDEYGPSHERRQP